MEMFTKKIRMEAGSKNQIKDLKVRVSKNKEHLAMFQNRTKNSWIAPIKTGVAGTKITIDPDHRVEEAAEEEDKNQC
jgi:hypothetical protein